MRLYIICLVYFVDQLKKELKKKEEAYNKLMGELKGMKHDLTVQEKLTSTTETSKKKYLSAVRGAQGLLTSLVTTVSNALEEIPDMKAEKEKVKKELMDGEDK